MVEKIILASASPRRLQLLQAAGFEPQVIAANVDESILKAESARKMVARVSRLKIDEILSNRLPSTFSGWVISADTTVVVRHKILGKPEDEKDARRMLRLISGKSHYVLTGYWVARVGEGQKVQAMLGSIVRTRVQIRQLTSKEIDQYLASGEPFDKAGAYAAQGIGMTLIQAIEGSYTNVVGLPVAEVLETIAKIRKQLKK